MRRKIAIILSVAITAALAVAEPALATTTSGMPWDGPLNSVLNSLQGNVARVFVLAAIIFTGFTWAFSEHGSGVRKFTGVLFGASLALGATALITAIGLSAATL